MKVGFFSYSDTRMAEDFGDLDDRHSGLDESGAEKMPKAMRPKLWQAGTLGQAFEQIR